MIYVDESRGGAVKQHTPRDDGEKAMFLMGGAGKRATWYKTGKHSKGRTPKRKKK